jgi:hypothetical protein
MEVSLAGAALALTAIGATAAMLAVLTVMFYARARRTVAECLLGAGAALVLILNAEVYALSLLPGVRPLKWLPQSHVLLLCVLFGFSLGRPGARGWAAALRAAVGEVRAVWARLGLLLRIALGGLLLVLLSYFVFGAYDVPWTWDELEYHVPMAIQPYQDGRVQTVSSDLPWANAYPRGVELIWYWTLQWSGTNLLFHPVQLAFGLQYLLAVFVLARRTGATESAAVLGVLVLATTPVFFALSTSGYIDLATAAAVISLVAFLAPARDAAAPLTRDWPLASLALAEACLVKLPLLAIAFGGLAGLQALLGRGSPRQRGGEAGRFLASPRGVASALIVLAACHTYWRNAIEHGNPLYPARFEVAGLKLDGPLDTARFGTGAHTSVGKPVADMTRWERFWYAWTDFRQPLDIDSFGSFGPVLLAILLPFLASLVLLQRPLDTWRLTLGAMFVLCLFTPSYLPRYGLPMAAVAVVGAMWLATRFGPASFRVFALVVLVLCVSGLGVSKRRMSHSLEWVRKQSGGYLALKTRNAFLAEHVPTGGPQYCRPDMIRYIRTHSGAGDLLVCNVRTFPALLWNYRYDNRVCWLTGTAGDSYPEEASDLSLPSPAELTDWITRVLAKQPRHVLLYTQSAYAQELIGHPEYGYRAALADPAERQNYAMTLFERVERAPVVGATAELGDG